MASIQARHRRDCALGKPWSPLSKQLEGCNCNPTLYVVIRDGTKLNRERVGKNKREAERALTKVQVQVDEGTYQAHENIRFSTWADRWRESLERKETTKDSYRSTVEYAKRVFGQKPVRRLGPSDITQFNVFLRGRKRMSDSTRAKHLRVLGACLQSALVHGYAARNPVRNLPPAGRPRATRKESAYFQNEELPRLFRRIPEGLYRTIFLLALKTGMRQGELVALTWRNVDLTEQLIRVRFTCTSGHVSVPKNHERRDVDITADLVELLGAWWGESGRPDNHALVFPGERGGHMDASHLLRGVLYPAMKRAKVPRPGPTGEKRTMHSMRHTYAKRALENGRQITWLSRHLGHSSLKVTTDVYGHWERAERKREAALMEGVFGV